MVARVLIGSSVFKVSRPGVDVNSASGDDLLLDLIAMRDQMVMRGTSLIGVVNITGFAVPPFVQLYHFAVNSLWDPSGTRVPAYIRPFPFTEASQYNATVGISATFLQFSGGNGNPLHYLVFRRALP